MTNSICVLYAYYEKDDMYKENLVYFLEHGFLEDVDYYIIVNGDCTLDIEEKDNLRIFKRENRGFDFGAWSYMVNRLEKEYDYYFFMNTSVRGPFLKEEEKRKWTELFIELLDEYIPIAGTTIGINIDKLYKDNSSLYHDRNVRPYIQSMFFVIDYRYLLYLKDKNFFNEEEINNYNNFLDIVYMKEISLSQLALKNGWNINCILSIYRGLDYITLDSDINPTSMNGDPYPRNCYFGNTIDKYQVIFIKTNRWIF